MVRIMWNPELGCIKALFVVVVVFFVVVDPHLDYSVCS